MPLMITQASPAQRDMILNNRRQHEREHEAMAARMGSGFIGNASPLPRDVWGEWDRESVQLQRDILAVYNDLVSVARTISIGKILHYFRQVSDSGNVNISIDGRSNALNDQQEYSYVGTPIPIIDSAFGYGWRQMAAAQSEGESLDSDGRDNAVRKVAEKLEDLVINGDSQIVVGGQTLYGLSTHPKRGTRSTGVTLNASTGAQWVTEFKATLALLRAKNFYTPATVYLNANDYEYAANTDYTTNYPKSILARLKELEGVKEIIPASKIPANDIAMVIKDRRVLQLINGMPLTTRAQARHNPEDDYNFKVMAASALEIKYDANDNCGVAYST